jgi:hypothetical protein
LFVVSCCAQALPKTAGAAAATAAAATAAAASRGAGQAGGKTAKAGGGQASSYDSSGSDADDAAASANGNGVTTGDSSSGEESGQGGFDLAKLRAKSGKRRTAGATQDASKGKPAVAAAASKKKVVSRTRRAQSALGLVQPAAGIWRGAHDQGTALWRGCAPGSPQN